MSVTYTKSDREKAEAEGLKLITINIGASVGFQGPISEEEEQMLLKYYLGFVERRQKAKENGT
jgi:hypothetical protein